VHVIATAGHVDHGKSTLVHRLTGMQPDRWAEERRRGLTIDLGFAWTGLDGRQVAFVDVPGHERFVPNMLAGIGPVPAALFVVAADEGWMAQSGEHLAALDAFGVRYGLLVVTKADRTDPEPVLRDARARIAETSLGVVPGVAVSGHTGAGLDELRAALAALMDRLPPPDSTADVRLWVDRAFTVRGAGTVVTGTLAAGTLRTGDELELDGRRVRVRNLQALGQDADTVGAVARVAVNLRGVDRDDIHRGTALLTPGAWLRTGEIDVSLRGGTADELNQRLVLHLGSAAIGVHVRPLGTDTARLKLDRSLPLRAGDIGLLRDPGAHRVAAGIEVLDVRPPSLSRRGAARLRAEELATEPVARALLRRAGFIRLGELRAMGHPPAGTEVGDWSVDEAVWTALPDRALKTFSAWSADHPLASGMPVEALRRSLELPAAELLTAALSATPLTVRDGLVRRPGSDSDLPPEVDRAVRVLDRGFVEFPFQAPEADHLAELGLGAKELAAAVRAGRLTRVTGNVVLGPDALRRAAEVLAGLPQPFTVSEARKALDSTRRVAVPLLESLDAAGITEQLPDGARRML
jgi:selenocysteine-specific elongation factor